MFVPLHDSTPLKVIRFQAVTITIIALNVVMYLATGAFNSEAVLQTIATGWGVVPGELTHSTSVAVPYHPVPEPFTLISYIEDASGHAAFALLYLTSGVVAALLYVLMAPGSDIPLVGASGAVSGILGAYVVLFPHARVWILLFLRIPLRIGALWVLGGWFLLQVFSWWMDSGNPEAGVAWAAHVGGFIAGAALTFALRRRLWMRLEP